MEFGFCDARDAGLAFVAGAFATVAFGGADLAGATFGADVTGLARRAVCGAVVGSNCSVNRVT